ncbi:helix-turn-helix transcriptional regulator [Paenibacillus sp. IITD108]|uniref:helix-turn-helix transcriptional regulator n=1 Tax=Paenibacillus sp. IITD108 TaxID=3116649 RepID=UPI002F4117C8
MEQARLIALRKYKGFTQQEIADHLKIDVRTYINKENGSSQFKANEMFYIAQLFQMNISEIFLPPNFMNHEVGKTTA